MLLLIFLLSPFFSPQQMPAVGIIDFYGLRSVTEKQVRSVLQISEGEALPDSFKDSFNQAQSRLEALPNVEQARVNAVCCDAGKLVLYVGIREKGSPAMKFRPAPVGAIRLPERMLTAGKEYEESLEAAVLKGDVGEDESRGYSLSVNSQVRSVQERFIRLAADDLQWLRRVLRESSDAKHRALAAEIIAYAANKRVVAGELELGMVDSDEGVRNNSMRALIVLAGHAEASPDIRIRIPAIPFVDMLNSIVWTDRNKASNALLRLTAKRDRGTLAILRKRALASLAEMARWKSQGHAVASFTVLGRVGNVPENEIERAWSNGNRELMIQTVLKRVK